MMAVKGKASRKLKKIPFKQSEYDRLVTRKAKASLAYKKAKRELDDYGKAHSSGIPRLKKGENWV